MKLQIIEWKEVEIGNIFDFENKTGIKAGEGLEKGKYKFFTSSDTQSKFIDRFNFKGEHYNYFSSFFMEIFYNQKNISVRNSIDTFLKDLFDRDTPFTKSDLDLYTELYKLLDRNMS